MIKRIFLSSLAVALTMAITFAQQKTMNLSIDNQWKKADSLMNKGLPQSAIKIAEDIFKSASDNKDVPNKIKAQLFLLSAGQSLSENAEKNVIKNAEKEISQSTGAEKALWQSITAQMYWSYYQNNRYKLLSRTALSETASSDMDTWDAPAFFNQITTLYKASVENREALRNIPVKQFDALIEKGKNTRHLRPTLYDLLVFRALDFFGNDEKDVINPAFKFVLDEAFWFDPAEKFSKLKVNIKDTSSLHFKALQLYQEVLAFHGNDARPDALIDADLQRLAFVYDNSVHSEKDSLYLAALRNLETKYHGNPAVAEVSFRIATQLLGDINENRRAYYGSGKNIEKADRDIPAVKTKLEQIIAKYPDTEGAVHAHNLLLTIRQKYIAAEVEEVNIPGENIRALIKYKNADKVYLKLFKVANTPLHHAENNDSLLKKISARQPLKSWLQNLPGTADMEEHAAEIKIDALTTGAYLLVTSLSENLKDNDNIVTSTLFQVSNLSLVTRSDDNQSAKIWILNRKNGQPVPHSHVTFWERNYDSRHRKYNLEEISTAQSNESGELQYPSITGSRYQEYITIVSGKDTLQLNGRIYNRYYGNTAQNDQTHTFFFTDRSIYRPGQTVFFKGIMIKNEADGKQSKVLPNIKTTVTFFDANNQKIRDLTLTTNEFGSFTGTFIAPESGLTGQMRISNGTGNVYVSVEEYKRPKFFVEFDSLKGDYALNQKVRIKGSAKAYAGHNIDGATVQYRVVRQARFPYFWAFYRWGMPSSPEMEIVNGTATTDANGNFELDFETLPDRSIDPKTLPVFHYKVYADVTDINGETRSGSQSVNAGYVGLQILADIPEEGIANDLDSIQVITQNINGIFVPSTIKMTVSSLQFPGKIYRERLWEKPDQFVMSEAEFRKAFPDDEYKDESDYRNWEKEAVLFENDFTTTPAGRISIPKKTWKKEGWHLIELSGKDGQGNAVVEKKYTYVSLPSKNGPIQKPLLVQTSKESYEPGEKLTLSLKTGFNNVYLLERSSLDNTAGVPRLLEPGKLEKTITESDRGGIGFSWLYVYNNRVYTATKTLDVPWTNKALQLEWASHRDKLLPGEAEEWTLTVKGDKKETVAAELLTGMYDASLDAFKAHAWNWNKLTRDLFFYNTWGQYGFDANESQTLQFLQEGNYKSFEKSYDRLDVPGFEAYGRPPLMYMARSQGANVAEESQSNMDMAPALQEKKETTLEFTPPLIKQNEEIKKNTEPAVQIRQNLQETAFFFPQLQTDAEGNIKFKFTMPEALTEWKMMAFAHTRDWKTGYLEGKVKTQKDLMVMPNLPRFLRQGDQVEISTKISNLSDKDLSGTATIEILDALTMQPVHLMFGLKDQGPRPFSVLKNQSTAASWKVNVPQSRYTPVIIRIVAKAGNFSDGEENAVPVITNRMLVTETLPLPVRGNATKAFTFEKLENQDSRSLVNHALTVEFTGNPAWYAVQALPYLMEYPYECAEQVFSRFYANALAAHIVAQSPKVEQIFKQWKTKDTAALLSNLEKNQELKSALLEETPWVLDAKNESAQKQNIARLFEAQQVARGLKGNLSQLAQMQLPEGAFPWFKGMQANRFVTQHIVTGIARLHHLGVNSAAYKEAEAIVSKALPYLDEQLKKDYDNLLKNKADLSKQQIGYPQIQYLYMRSFYKNKPVPSATKTAFEFYQKQAAQYWNSFNPYMKGMIALSLDRLGDKKAPAQIMASLKETAINDQETGMYWKSMPAGYWWYQAPIEAQSLLIEAFAEVSSDRPSVDAMKVWLLKQKQTQNWRSTKATADAVYALLLKGGDWLASEPVVTIGLGKETIKSSEVKTEAGTGYFKQRLEGKDVLPGMGDISVKVDQVEDEGVSWGAVYWQYFEDLDKITSTETPLGLKKQLFIERNSDRGPVLTEIKDGNSLKVGDKVKVRIILQVDRDMEYVHMKDMRAACFEPVNVLSGYNRYQGGLGYYESTKDVSTHFFFDYLRKGTYVFEYPVFVGQKGDFSNGISTIQCMYAPEFSSHSEGIRVRVE